MDVKICHWHLIYQVWLFHICFVKLLQCILRYEATGPLGWYAVALQIEDFASTTDLVPLSSVPAQFLVLVFPSSEPCSSRPEFVGVTRVTGSCIGVPFNTTYHEPIIAQSGGAELRLADPNKIFIHT